jgi:hypothetical protein
LNFPATTSSLTDVASKKERSTFDNGLPFFYRHPPDKLEFFDAQDVAAPRDKKRHSFGVLGMGSGGVA